MSRRFRDFTLILLSSILLAVPYHFDKLWLLAYFAFVPFFFALKERSTGSAFKISYLFGFLFFTFLGYWLGQVSVLGLVVLTAYLAVYFALFGYLSVGFLGRPRGVLTISAFWVALEFLRGWVITGLPWALLAYSQWKNLPVIQIADITGAYGVSFFVMLVNLLIYSIAGAFQGAPDRTKLVRRSFFLLGAVVFAVWVYGFASLHARDAAYQDVSKFKRARVSVLQGNIPQEQKWDRKIKDIIFEKYKRLMFMSAIDRSDLIVWPETAFPGYFEDEPLMAAQLRGAVRQTRTDVLVGAPTLGDMEKGLKFFNSAILFGADGEERRRYHKVHLVPFGEFVPFEPWMSFIRRFFDIGRFHAGSEKTVFETQTRYQSPNHKIRFGVLICFEDIFPGLVRDFCRGGADFLINVTNDAWFGKTAAPYQHAQASLFRAVENRVPVVRATNTGLSCFISPEGRILAGVKEKGREIFVTGRQGHDLLLRKTTSFYTRFGDVFMALVFGLCFLAYRNRSRGVS